MPESVAPPGWPANLPSPHVPEFGQRVVGWLLDRGPGRWRSHAVLRRHPGALARLVADHLQAQLEGLRTSYASARRLLGETMPVDEMTELLTAIEAEGSLAAEDLRQVELVAEALAGRRWRARL